MKIVDVKFYSVRPMGNRPIASGSVLEWAFVEIETDDGVVGLGECSNWVHQSTGIIRGAIEQVKQLVIGQDAQNIEAIWQKIYSAYSYLGSRGLITTVISGIDIALWDIQGKVLGRPIYSLLGGAVRSDVNLYVHPGPIELISREAVAEEIAESSLKLVAEGYTGLKIDPFVEIWGRHADYQGGTISRHGVRQAADIVERMRQAVGPDIDIMIDAHGAFNVASAVECMRALEPYSLTWFEEPLPPDSIEALAQVRERVNVALCIGERLYSRWDVAPYLQRGLVDFLMPDVCWTGGISELRRIAALAEVYYVPMSPHDALGPIQIVAGAHVMMNTPNFFRLEFHALWLEWHNRCLTEPLDIQGGRLQLSDRPGLGFELDHEFLSQGERSWSV